MLLILLFVLVLVVTGVALFGHGCGLLAERGILRASLPVWLRALAALCGAVAAGVYACGLLIVVLSTLSAEDGGTDSSPARPCRTAGWWERHQRGVEIVGHSVSFVPLGFVCETSDGGRYDNGDVPEFVNPGTLGFALAGAGCAVGSGYATRLAARGAQGAGTGRRGTP